MADIKLVINITKHEWEYLNKLVKNGDQLGHYERLLVNGIPLDEERKALIEEVRSAVVDIPANLFGIYEVKARVLQILDEIGEGAVNETDN